MLRSKYHNRSHNTLVLLKLDLAVLSSGDALAQRNVHSSGFGLTGDPNGDKNLRAVQQQTTQQPGCWQC